MSTISSDDNGQTKKVAQELNDADFTALTLKKFVSPGFGVVLDAPEHWEDTSTEQFFQVTEPETETYFTASAYGNAGASLEQWASVRLSAVAKGMPFLRQIVKPYFMNGVGWTGVAAEYRGIYPDNTYESHFLVLCFRTENMAISFTITATAEVFVKKEAFYRWLLANHMEIYTIIKND